MSNFLNDASISALWACVVIAFAASSISYSITQTVCEIKAKFEKTTTVIKIRMIKENSDWKINDFMSVE